MYTFLEEVYTFLEEMYTIPGLLLTYAWFTPGELHQKSCTQMMQEAGVSRGGAWCKGRTGAGQGARAGQGC